LQQSIIPYIANIAYDLFSSFDAKKKKQRTGKVYGFISTNFGMILETSYKVAEFTVKAKKSHTIAEI
jgi:hypothetical protein